MASECMIVGTISEIIPVIQIEDRLVGDGKPGPITRRLQQGFNAMVSGSINH
jgi:branched-subunit amino acid aminotransferase/4-amino-4-deoxychorismate lyase